VFSQQPQHAEDAAAEAIEQTGRERGRAGDRVVGRAQLFVAPLERLGDVRVGRDLGQPVAGDVEPQAQSRISDARHRTLVDEAVIDAAVGSSLLELL
jgi:hypothetical protein